VSANTERILGNSTLVALSGPCNLVGACFETGATERALNSGELGIAT